MSIDSSRSESVDAALPTSIGSVLDRAAEVHADVDALVDGPTRLSYAELRTAVREAARAFVASGVTKGDRVAIWAPNMGEWVIASQALHRIGAVIAAINTRFKGPEVAHNIELAGARMLLTVTDFLDSDYVAMLAATGVPSCVEEIIVLRGPSSSYGGANLVSWDEFLGRADGTTDVAVDALANSVQADDLSDIIFTSGTTGRPKGAAMKHGASIRAFDAWTDVIGLEAGDRYLIINPFFHAFGLKAGILASILRGATIIPHPVFDVPSVMARVAEERVTMLPGPPAIYQSILDHPELSSFDLSSLRLAVTGAAPVPVEMISRMRDELGFETIVTGYGLTEAHGIVTMNRHDDPPEVISGTDGRPIPGVEVITVDVDGSAVPTGEPGEIWVRGYNLMDGYFGDASASASAVVDGWLQTGDIGIFDDGGNLKITGRLKDMFIVGGFNAYPAEIENTILGNDAVSQVAVVGIPDDRLGEVGVAFVIPRPGATVDPDGLIAWCRDLMANYKVPRTVHVVDEFPMNATNKIVKTDLVARAVAAS